MKKIWLIIVLAIFFNLDFAKAEEDNLQEMDAEAREQSQASGSLLFRRNAEEYRQLSDAEKKEIEVRRENAIKMRKQQEEMMRRQAEEEARIRAEQEAQRRAAEALRPITLYGNKLKIYALVNGEPITSADMQSHINAFIMTTGIPYNSQTKQMITTKVLQNAIDDKLKIQEAKKNGISVSQKEVNDAVRRFEQGNNLQPGQLKSMLDSAKVSAKAWSAQIIADIAWNKLISSKAHSVANVGENDITKALGSIKDDMKKEKFMLLELVVSKKDAKGLNELAQNLRQDPRFELYAMQFSQSPSAKNGGRLGWVTKGQLPQTLENAVLKLKEGGVSNPIAYGNDYYILKLEKIFNPARDAKSLPSRNEIREMLVNKRLEEYSNKYLQNLRSHALIEKKV
jgi:parvulin-like peptidyl-prolyl isomerase